MVVATRGPGPRQPPPDLDAHPSEEELVTSFLRPCAASGAPPPCAFVHDADVYSADPAELTAAFAPAVAGGNGEMAWYFLSAVRAKTRAGQRKARTVDSGEGCWHSEAGAKPVVDDAGRCLGHLQSFSFVTKVDGRRVRSGWLMVELGLDDDDAMVLCKIYFSPRARVGGGGAAAAAGRKRKAAAAAGDRNSPAPAARRRRRARAMATEAGAPLDDDEEEEKESTQGGCGGVVKESSAAGGEENGKEEELWTDDSFFSWWMRNRDQLMEEYGIVDRSDEEILKDTGFDKILKLMEHDMSRFRDLDPEDYH